MVLAEQESDERRELTIECRNATLDSVMGSFFLLPHEITCCRQESRKWKVCRTGTSDIRFNVCGITPASHVTQRAKDMANAGRTRGAGLVAGACFGQTGENSKTLVSGSGSSVEVDGWWANRLAASRACTREGTRVPLASYGWCRGQGATTKGMTGLCWYEDAMVALRFK